MHSSARKSPGGSSGSLPTARPRAERLEGQATVISSSDPLPAPSAAVVERGESSLPRLGPGSRLGTYELLECVGGGGMGRVFRARDLALDRIVAIKVLFRDQADDPDTLARFRNEAQSAARLNHENVVQVYFVGEEGALPYIAFEFIEGKNIRKLVEERGALSLAEALSYTFQIAEALAHAADRGVVHRDIKPSNALITAEGRVKLIDMGLARVQRVDPSADLTASGVTLGTFDYISPEQARDPRTADVRSDIYSLGCTLFYMLAGQPPFPEGTVLQKLLQHQGDEPPDVRQFRPELPEPVSRLVRRMMAKDPRRRFQAPRDLLAELLRLTEELGLERIEPGEPLWSGGHEGWRGALERQLPWLAPFAVLVSVVILLDFLWSLPGREDSGPGPPPIAEADAAAAEKSVPVREPAPISPKAKTAPEAKPAGASQKPAAAPEAKTAAAPVVPAAKPPAPGVLVVDGVGEKQGHFGTLAAACGKAAGGDVIELRYNGPRQERPLSLSNQRLTIRGGEGFQPAIVFRPTEPDLLRSCRAMISLQGSQVTLVNLSLEMELSRQLTGDGWSLIECRNSESLKLQRCLLTIRNAGDRGDAFHADVAFFRVRGLLDAQTLLDEPVAGPRSTIALTDCIVRGEATVLRLHHLRPVQLVWENGLLATSERLLASDGGTRAPAAGETIGIELQHVTAVLGRGLCLLSQSEAGPRQLPLSVHCSDSILLGAAGANLIEQSGVGTEPAEPRIAWNGERVFYQGFSVFWNIVRGDADVPPTAMAFDAWRAHWGPQREVLAALDRVAWRALPAAEAPLHEVAPEAYALAPTAADGSSNPAVGAGSDGKDAGMIADRLLPIPAPIPLP